MNLHDWLSAEIAAVEERLQGQGPTCQLDRQRAAPASLKETEGRYAILRRARRLLERGDSLAALDAEATKAHAALNGTHGLARDVAWQAYFTGVLGALDDLARQQNELSAAGDPERS